MFEVCCDASFVLQGLRIEGQLTFWLTHGCFCKLGALFRRPYDEDPGILGSILGPLIFGNPRMQPLGGDFSEFST